MVSLVDNLDKVAVDSDKDKSLELAVNSEPEPEEARSTYKIRLELAAFLLFFGVNMSYAVFQDEVLFRSCTIVYGYNESVCQDLRLGKAISDPEIQMVENIVQPFAANIFMTETFVQAIVPAILSLFLGAWTDKFGRKPVIILTTVGYLGFSLIKTIVAGLSLWFAINPWVYVAASVPLSLCGGEPTLQTVLFCYVADLTTLRERPLKMCIMAGTIAFSAVIGQVSSGFFYSATNACAVFALSSLTKILAIIFVVFAIKESVDPDQLSSESKFEGLYNGQLFKDMFKTLLKKREHFETPVIWCAITLIVVVAFDNAGITGMFFLFLRKKFGWSMEEVTTFNAVALVITYVGATGGTYILQYLLRVRLTVMALIAFVSYFFLSIFFGTAFTPWYLYIGVTLTCFSGVASPLGQSMLSNIVPASEIGKLFTFVSALQAIAPLISSPIYTVVYNATIETLPSAFNFIGSGLYSVCIILVVFIHIVDSYYPKVNVERKEKNFVM